MTHTADPQLLERPIRILSSAVAGTAVLSCQDFRTFIKRSLPLDIPEV